MMFDDLIKEPTVNVSQEEAHIVKALIAGDPSRCPSVSYFARFDRKWLKNSRNLKGKEFLFEIVANKRNGLDVDKCVSTISTFDLAYNHLQI